jgi:hypothetical protein
MRFKKTDVTVRYYRPGAVPCVNVKVYQVGWHSSEAVMEKFGCSEAQAEKALQFAFDSECHSFWEYWQDKTGDYENGIHGSAEYAYFPDHTVRVECEGRSGGWLAVRGLPPVEEWDAILVGRWNKFQKAVLEDVKYRSSTEALLEGIESNEWWKEHSSQYNFCETAQGHVCLADVRADVIAYATEKHGFVPCLSERG